MTTGFHSLRMRFWQSRLWRARRALWFWGYIYEASLWLRSLFRRRTPPIRFVIFGQGRTGSTLLCELLDSHPRIHCDKEILYSPVISPLGLTRRAARLARGEAYGFKVKIYQLTEDQKIRDVRGFLTCLRDEGWKILYLSRRNLLRHALSDIVLMQCGRAHRRQPTPGTVVKRPLVRVGRELLLKRMQMRRQWQGEEEEALRGLDVLRVVYDEDLYTPETQQETVRRITNWLGLPHVPVQTTLV